MLPPIPAISLNFLWDGRLAGIAINHIHPIMLSIYYDPTYYKKALEAKSIVKVDMG